MGNIDQSDTVAIFDLDGTLTWHDTLLPFLGGYLASRPARFLRLWRLPVALLAYLRARGSRGVLKARLIRAVMSGDTRAEMDAWSGRFVAAMRPRGLFRPAALEALQRHRHAGHRLVLMSASPDLYVPQIAAMLGFELTECTRVSWQGERLDGTLQGENCLGEEKVRRLQALRARFPGATFVAYGNSRGDLAHLRAVDQGTLVNANRGARALALRCGIPVDDWR
jgi:phosphatidylglycerophosphatase C